MSSIGERLLSVTAERDDAQNTNAKLHKQLVASLGREYIERKARMNQTAQNAELLKRLDEASAIHAAQMAKLQKQLDDATALHAAQTAELLNQLDEVKTKQDKLSKQKAKKKTKRAEQKRRDDWFLARHIASMNNLENGERKGPERKRTRDVESNQPQNKRACI